MASISDISVDGTTYDIKDSTARGKFPVGTSDIAGEAITTAKLANGAVTTAKLDDGAVTGSKISNGSVSTLKIADSAVTTAKLGSKAVTNAKIASGAVTSDKIDFTTLWSGIKVNYNYTAITLSDSISNYKYIDFVVRLANWTDNDTNVVIRHNVGAMSYSVGSCHISLAYTYSGVAMQIRTGTLRMSGTSVYWESNRSSMVQITASGSSFVVPTSDGDAIALIKVIGYA